MFAIQKENGFFDVRRFDTFEEAADNLRADGDVVIECNTKKTEKFIDPEIFLRKMVGDLWL